ncbi:hypothetical protein [Albimonas pacifica]|uniref:DUF2190 family protein n=1 Tax=Albimonas pacifica TaxID=1114924 RepID=A0A1I3LI10_9RHOB|nr:hypothetical protein [Albimonas pacifica]SFI84055.1 hypothetical protein SAMN05216258_11026 [Albimonas pacifica]
MTVAINFGRDLYTGAPLFVPRSGACEVMTATTGSASFTVTARKDEHAKITNTHTAAVYVNVNADASPTAFVALIPVGAVDYIPKLGEGDVIHVEAVA